MRVLVAGRARPILELELHRGCRTLRHWLVAVRAGDRNVRAGQWETRLFVFGQCEHRGTETLQVVACLAAIQGRSSGKLSFVNVFVAILALGRRNLEFRILAFW